MRNGRGKTTGKYIGKTALICGGSKGIGKETAKEFYRQGGSVCLLARDPQSLDQAKKEVEALRLQDDQSVFIIAGDASKFDEISPLITNYVEQEGVPDYLINAVGYAYPEYVQNLQIEDFERNMDVNYYGQLVPTMILIPYFMKQKNGHISFVSSMMGYMGIIGYASYAPTKFALVGLAEVLRHELAAYNISVSVLYPPDTDTPGFEQENETKPFETAALSETAKLYKPEVVAKYYLEGVSRNKFQIMFGEGIWIWRLYRLFPKLVHGITDRDLRKAQKKLNDRK